MLKSLGFIAGALTFLLWFIFSFMNPYANPTSEEPVFYTFVMLVLPACLAIFSTLKSKKWLMIIAFVWSLPISLYMLATLGIFALFGGTSFLYLICFFFMHTKFNKEKQNAR